MTTCEARSIRHTTQYQVLPEQVAQQQGQLLAIFTPAAPINENTPKTSGIRLFGINVRNMQKSVGAASFTPAAPINENTPKTNGIRLFGINVRNMQKTVGAASFTPAAPINENTPKTNGIVCLALIFTPAAPINEKYAKTNGIVCLAIFSVCLALICEICKKQWVPLASHQRHPLTKIHQKLRLFGISVRNMQKTVGAASFTPAAPINENTPKTNGIRLFGISVRNMQKTVGAASFTPNENTPKTNGIVCLAPAAPTNESLCERDPNNTSYGPPIWGLWHTLVMGSAQRKGKEPICILISHSRTHISDAYTTRRSEHLLLLALERTSSVDQSQR
ncbi:hypothetical protein J6590_090933 [Homalodisca vitripennis]|nr:hypothetical protein J6590_090933 [Homalodisca vitripennis]